MNIKKSIKAILLGSLTLFIWGAFSHLVIITGVGYKPLPNEDQITNILHNSIPEKGLYFFPRKSFKNNTSEQETQWLAKYKNGPVGLLIYRPVGGNPFSVKKLVTQFASYLVSTFFVVLLLSFVKARYWEKVFIVTLFGFVGCLSVAIIYWNWYEYPTSFILAQFFDITMGFLLLGLVLAKILPTNIHTNKS